ncbi:predicted protein, partial [Nematostella vectensis]
MKIVGAGLPKTGTKSLAAALRHLGYKVHDGPQQWQHHLDEYIAAFNGNIPNSKEMYECVDATTASPACFFYKEISAAFPNARVILSVRDNEEIWRKSLDKSLQVSKASSRSLWMMVGKQISPTGRKWKTIQDFISNTLFVKNTDKDSNIYQKHNDDVIASISANQLLVFNPKEGWEPLCAFLGVEVPAIPFPRVNVDSEY